MMVKLTEMPQNIARLPRDDRGYPVPWFVDWVDGKPQFPLMDGRKFIKALKEKLCWVCGGPMGVNSVFVLGPMCGITRTTAEPPCHLGCATFSVQNCPFLVNPAMKRIENELTKQGEAAGIMIKRNPGVTLLWTTRKYKVFNDGNGGALIRVGDPIYIEGWARGLKLEDVQPIYDSIESGIPCLLEQARTPDDCLELGKITGEFKILLAYHFRSL